MFVVIFEVEPRKERWDEYLDIAKVLRPELEKVDGFIDNERFVSQRAKTRILSLSTWRDEKALIRWRTLGVHHAAQRKGRFEVFADYRLRVGEITADTQVPQGYSLRESRFDETDVGEAKAVTLSEFSPDSGARSDLAPSQSQGPVHQDVYDSIYQPGKTLLVCFFRDMASAARFQPRPRGGETVRHRLVRVVRDYGMFDRREAPQYYAEPSAQGRESG